MKHAFGSAMVVRRVFIHAALRVLCLTCYWRSRLCAELAEEDAGVSCFLQPRMAYDVLMVILTEAICTSVSFNDRSLLLTTKITGSAAPPKL